MSSSYTVMKDEQSVNEFLGKFLNNLHTEEEHDLFIEWLHTAPADEVEEILEKYQKLSDVKDSNNVVQHTELFRRIEDKLDHITQADVNKVPAGWSWSKSMRHVSIAATFLIAIMFILFFNSKSGLKEHLGGEKHVTRQNKGLISGSKSVTLELADGSQIPLSSANIGLLATESGSKISKVGSGHVVYASSASPVKEVGHNIISTPKGGTYMITLSDGTKVWLNAASSLKFPASFNSGARHVELVGEGYFEVAKQHMSKGKPQFRPFYVSSKGQTVEVLGTHFNVKSYPEEPVATTTLLEGSVRVSESSGYLFKTLKPGQQSRVNREISIKDVDAEAAIAWKNGIFNFANENIEDIMRNISRWYDVEVIYESGITSERFVGSISRYKNVSDVLEMLELTGAVHFKVEGRRITVMN